MVKTMDVLYRVGEWVEWLSRHPVVPKKDGALRFGILGAASIGSVLYARLIIVD
jgi:hypothetical protein